MPDLQIVPTGGALGARVEGIDLSQPLDDGTVKALRQAFLDHCLLLFRDQRLSKVDQVRFSHVFGEPVPHPTNTRDRDPEVPELTIISNVVEEGKAIGALGNAELDFHADLVFLHEPGSVSILHCVETPESDGDTYWTNGYAGYQALDAETKERIRDLKVVYQHRNPDYNPDPLAVHPVVCIHPESRRPTLFISPSAAHAVEGLGEAEGRALLDWLMDRATQERFVWRHSWRPGDVVVWDNRCTLHRRDGFDNSQRRVMRRTQMVGAPTA